MDPFLIFIVGVISAAVFFGILYGVVYAAVKKAILDCNFVDAIRMGIEAADERRGKAEPDQATPSED